MSTTTPPSAVAEKIPLVPQRWAGPTVSGSHAGCAHRVRPSGPGNHPACPWGDAISTTLAGSRGRERGVRRAGVQAVKSRGNRECVPGAWSPPPMTVGASPGAVVATCGHPVSDVLHPHGPGATSCVLPHPRSGSELSHVTRPCSFTGTHHSPPQTSRKHCGWALFAPAQGPESPGLVAPCRYRGTQPP